MLLFRKIRFLSAALRYICQSSDNVISDVKNNTAYNMLYQLEVSQEIEPDYFMGNLVGDCEFTNKYKEMIKNSSKDFSMEKYLYDIIKLIEADEREFLNFWLRNVEVYILYQSRIFSEIALEGELKQTIWHLAGGATDTK